VVFRRQADKRSRENVISGHLQHLLDEAVVAQHHRLTAADERIQDGGSPINNMCTYFCCKIALQACKYACLLMTTRATLRERSMKFGAFDHMDAGDLSPDLQYKQRLQFVRLYEELGFYAYHLAEHHATPLGIAASPSVFLAAVATQTRTLRFGPLVYLLPLHHPVRLLEEIAMLDLLSDGRFQLGVGRGGAPVEHARYGLREQDLEPMFEECLAVLMKGLTSDVLNHDGTFYKLHDVPILVKARQRPHPPLWYGTGSPDRAPWAVANKVNLLSLQPAARTRQISDRFKQEWRAAGANPAEMPFMGMSRHVFVAPTDAEAKRIAARAWRKWVGAFRWLSLRSGVAPKIPLADDFDTVMGTGFAFAGSPESVRAWIARNRDEAGINYLAAELTFGDMTTEEATRCIELFGREVIPAFRARTPALVAT
jgi:alkanesulfonate monooxygenase SsuD/methylene tetrahydromethanopterin reductase-like flavin-dependent oxidoreductase (luciferase family)